MLRFMLQLGFTLCWVSSVSDYVTHPLEMEKPLDI